MADPETTATPAQASAPAATDAAASTAKADKGAEADPGPMLEKAAKAAAAKPKAEAAGAEKAEPRPSAPGKSLKDLPEDVRELVRELAHNTSVAAVAEYRKHLEDEGLLVKPGEGKAAPSNGEAKYVTKAELEERDRQTREAERILKNVRALAEEEGWSKARQQKFGKFLEAQEKAGNLQFHQLLGVMDEEGRPTGARAVAQVAGLYEPEEEPLPGGPFAPEAGLKAPAEKEEKLTRHPVFGTVMPAQQRILENARREGARMFGPNSR